MCVFLLKELHSHIIVQSILGVVCGGVTGIILANFNCLVVAYIVQPTLIIQQPLKNLTLIQLYNTYQTVATVTAVVLWCSNCNSCCIVEDLRMSSY